ncbi:MAG: transaldolase, partial [Candidatus Bipolaricaulota bacterium]
MATLEDYAIAGQSIWLDFIRRSFMTSGDLQRLIDLGLRGMTSNPSIFERAIAHSDDYDFDLTSASAPVSAEEVYKAIVVEDIRAAADHLRSIYDGTQGVDGYVSLEVSPLLAQDARETVTEARRLAAAVDRPNVMIKGPATKEGAVAIRELIEDGIH